MAKKDLRPLSEIKAGQTVKLVSIDAGQNLNSRLIAMGLVPNTELKVIKNHHHGPFVISVKNSKMVLGRGIAHKVIVAKK